MDLYLRIVVYFLHGGDFPPYAVELQFSALVLLGQHLVHLLQLCLHRRGGDAVVRQQLDAVDAGEAQPAAAFDPRWKEVRS